jgi:hypothetical protein
MRRQTTPARIPGWPTASRARAKTRLARRLPGKPPEQAEAQGEEDGEAHQQGEGDTGRRHQGIAIERVEAGGEETRRNSDPEERTGQQVPQDEYRKDLGN